MIFEWDSAKNKTNLRKHGIDFEEAKTVFYDEHGIVFDDPAHSSEEERFIILGMSLKSNICILLINDMFPPELPNPIQVV